VDALGNPTGLHLTAGQSSDLEGADVLLKGVAAHTVIADKAYDAQGRVVQPLLQAGKAVVIPCIGTRKVQRSYDRHLYKTRHLIENFLARLKAIPRYRHALRQDRRGLPGRCALGGIYRLAQLMIGPSRTASARMPATKNRWRPTPTRGRCR